MDQMKPCPTSGSSSSGEASRGSPASAHILFSISLASSWVHWLHGQSRVMYCQRRLAGLRRRQRLPVDADRPEHVLGNLVPLFDLTFELVEEEVLQRKRDDLQAIHAAPGRQPVDRLACMEQAQHLAVHDHPLVTVPLLISHSFRYALEELEHGAVL